VPDIDVLWDPDQIDDDVLALTFIVCHPVVSREARVALTLRVIGGLTSDEIARAFLVPTATVRARIPRAKKTIAAARVPFEVPPPQQRRERLGSVLSVVYVIFTERSAATSGEEWIRSARAEPAAAVRLCRQRPRTGAAATEAGRSRRGERRVYSVVRISSSVLGCVSRH
jgi:predicted RNA polymerase sigma factor